MNKVRTQTKPKVTPPVDDPTMTLEGYLKAVVEDQLIGGRSWAQSAVAVLLQRRPALCERVWQGNRDEMLYSAEQDTWVFIYWLTEHWDQR